MHPVRFERLVERVRRRFERDRDLQATLATFQTTGISNDEIAAAAAALVSEGFLEWWDGRLIRTDVPKAHIIRRTA